MTTNMSRVAGRSYRHVAALAILAVLCWSAPIWALSWQQVPVPVPIGTSLNGVWGSSPNDVFAVGDNGVIAHFNGTTWSAMTSNTTHGLSAVWGTSATNVYAVGINSGGTATIIHYDGSNWSVVSHNIIEPLAGIWGTAADLILEGDVLCEP